MAKKTPKSPRPNARLPRGLIDRSAPDIRTVDQMMDTIRHVYELYGFDPVETPLLEYTDALGKFLPDSDRPNEGVFSLTDDDKQWLSLRYDLTAPLARHVAQNFNDIHLPYRTYRAGYVFRNEKPGPGRFRQFMQFDADSVGAPSISADVEMCMMMADTMEALGIERDNYVVRINNRKVLDGIMTAIGVTDDKQKLTIMRSLDKQDKFGIEGVEQLLGQGRKDESGDFTKGAGLENDAVRTLLDFLAIDDMTALFDWFTKLAPEGDASGITELGDMKALIDAANYGDRMQINTSVVRGLEYYTGPVYECELLFPVINDKGETVQFGAVAGGGRYDGLIKRFTGQPVPATGFSIGVSRLMTALKNLGKLEQNHMPAPVIVCIMDKDIASLARYQSLVTDLRNNNIRAELYHGNPKANFGKQLQYADRRGAAVAIIQGSDERARQEVQIKDLIAGAEAAKEIDNRAQWSATRPAQFACPENRLVEEVRKVLSNYQG